jgi:RimJ/RimL family protein N-acetyltransferase
MPSDDDGGVRIEPWQAGDLPLLERLLGDPAMTEHIGGPESPAQIAVRHGRYLGHGPGIFRVVEETTGLAIGWVGYWEREWRGEAVFETGWSVLREYQGRGVAQAATTQALARARAEGRLRFVHAFPSVGNPPSNAICRRLGFTWLGECDVEYPKGAFMRCHDWRYDLRAG